jgi:hypothetical protein
VLQRGQRISFGNNSPNGVLLFRAASAVVNTFLSSPAAAAALSPDATDAWAKKYKPVFVCGQLMSRALDGGFLNFGVLKLYNDASLDQSVNFLLKALLDVPLDALFSFPKLAQMYMVVLHLLFRNHIDFMVVLPRFAHVCQTLILGLDSIDVEVASHASCAIDFLATFYVKNHAKDSPAANALRAQVQAAPRIFHDFMVTLFRVLVFDDSAAGATTMSLIRPLLPSILAAQLVQPAALEEYRSELLQTQPEERRARMNSKFDELAADVMRCARCAPPALLPPRRAPPPRPSSPAPFPPPPLPSPRPAGASTSPPATSSTCGSATSAPRSASLPTSTRSRRRRAWGRRSRRRGRGSSSSSRRAPRRGEGGAARRAAAAAAAATSALAGGARAYAPARRGAGGRPEPHPRARVRGSL